jgi:protein SCO1
MKKEFDLLTKIFIITIPILFLFSSYANAETDYPEVTKHLGKILPLDLTFTSSHGKQVLLKDLINKPTVIDFVYYRCTGICTPLMAELSEIIGKVKYEPGKDYDVISISIDQLETPKIAAEKKHDMLSISSKVIPDSAWTFLTGDSTSIYKLTNAAGFKFVRVSNGFLHKGVLIFVDKTGKIVQYLSPGYVKQTGDFAILPSEFELAVEKAGKGEITSTIEKVLQTCSTFVAKGKSAIVLFLVFASGIITITTVLIIIKKTKVKHEV